MYLYCYCSYYHNVWLFFFLLFLSFSSLDHLLPGNITSVYCTTVITITNFCYNLIIITMFPYLYLHSHYYSLPLGVLITNIHPEHAIFFPHCSAIIILLPFVIS
jgi:hypothetical protein